MSEGPNATEGWSKWYLAAAFGIPVIGIGSWWYWKRSKRQQAGEESDDEVQQPTETSPCASAESSPEEISIQKALEFKGKGNKYFKGSKFKEAIRCYTDAIAVCPPDKHEELATFYQNRAAANEQLREYDQVVEDCTAALEWNKQYLKALNRRAKGYEILGGADNLQLCLEDITAVCILEQFTNQASLVMADRVLKEVGRHKAKDAYVNRVPEDPSGHFVKLFLESFANDPIVRDAEEATEAIHNFEQFAAERGDDTSAYFPKHYSSPYYRAAIQAKNGDFQNIIELTSQEIEDCSSKKIPESLLLRATFNMLRGEGNKAMADLNRLLDLDVVSRKCRANALIKRGNLHMQAGSQQESLADYATASKTDPENSDVYHHRGQLMLLMDRVEEAVDDLRKSADLQPSFALTHVQLCYTEYRAALLTDQQSLLREKLTIFKDTAERFPDCAEGFALYGQALADQQQYTEADDYFERAQELDPRSGNILVHRGLLRLQWKSDIDAAVSFIEEALKRDANCEFAYETLGTIEVQRGNLVKAVDLFNKSISLAKTEVEMTHLCSLLQAAKAQSIVAKKFGIQNANLIPSEDEQRRFEQ